MKYKTVQISNLRALIRAHQAILNRAPGRPGMAIAHGPAGAGKTSACLWLYNECNGIYLEASPLWTPDGCSAISSASLARRRPT